MPTRDDHPTLIDQLDRLKMVRKLSREVLACTPPRVFGVHGDWGAGKTSFLHQIHVTLDGNPARRAWVERQEELFSSLTIDPKPDFVVHTSSEARDPAVVWFEAWRYQHEPAPVVALLHEMRGQLGLIARAKAEAWKLTEVTIRTALLQLEQIAKYAWLQSAAGITTGNSGLGIVATAQAQGERWERDHLAEKLPAETLREQLEHAVAAILGRARNSNPSTGRRVVVLIDDLDRCEPHATYRLLEGIKIYLNIPNCVFVLGMDQRIIEDAIAETAPGAKDQPELARRRAREYLEKLFQEVYHLPIVQDVHRQLVSWLDDGSSAVSATARKDLLELFTAYPGCVPANPRKVKAFAAVLRRFLTEPSPSQIRAAGFLPLLQYSEVAARKPYLALVVIMASLYHFHPEIYRVLEAHTDGFYEELWRWTTRTGVDKDNDHGCLAGLDRAFKIVSPALATAATLPEAKPLYVDYSRGNVLRVQQLLYHARPYTKAQIQSLLLK